MPDPRQIEDMKIKGFTLVELLVVIAIIGLLSSVVFASLQSARVKARDAKRIADFKAVSAALQFYYDKYDKYPNETPVDTNAYKDNFNDMAAKLVAEGFLGSVPVNPSGAYQYYNYIRHRPDPYLGIEPGALLVTDLEAAPNTTTGIPPSCRPWAANQNWCSQASTKEYCLCHPY